MGPLELQLYRELAIQMVHMCSRYHQALGYQQEADLAWYRLGFERLYEEWLTTTRVELGGLTPAEAIHNERKRPVWAGPDDSAPLQRVELYTDLPQAEDVTDRIEVEPPSDGATDLAAPTTAPWLSQSERAPAPDRVDNGRPHSPTDEARWRAFYDRYLRGWLDE